MMIARQVLLTELNYTIWANEILLEACSALSSEELSRPLVASHTSIIRTLRHIYDGECAWIDSLLAGAIPDIADMEAAGAADQWISQLSDEDLALELISHERDGTVIAVPRWQVILHMVNHSTLHRGQIVNLFRALGKTAPPNTDLFTYYRFRPDAR